MENIKLLGNRVLVEVDTSEKKTTSGIILAREQNPSEVSEGVIVSVGNGSWDKGMFNPINGEIILGKKVLFQYGKSILVEGKQLILVAGDDIIMVI